jgi:hypothetical protein
MAEDSPFRQRSPEVAARYMEPDLHVMREGVLCDTDSRGYPTPRNLNPLDLVVDASEGFIPLWDQGVTLRWRFQRRSLEIFQDPTAAAAEIRRLFGEALLAWGDAAPVRFANRNDKWDFEIVVRSVDNCSTNGCVLASAFFPDTGRHELRIYPQMFTQSRKEQVDTLVHEIGHAFGLRHFFAAVSEQAWPSQIFGEHRPFSIMNYGEMSELTDLDKSNLSTLYRSAWSGDLNHINGTPVRLVKPFSSLAPGPSGVFAFAASEGP